MECQTIEEAHIYRSPVDDEVVSPGRRALRRQRLTSALSELRASEVINLGVAAASLESIVSPHYMGTDSRGGGYLRAIPTTILRRSPAREIVEGDTRRACKMDRCREKSFH